MSRPLISWSRYGTVCKEISRDVQLVNIAANFALDQADYADHPHQQRQQPNMLAHDARCRVRSPDARAILIAWKTASPCATIQRIKTEKLDLIAKLLLKPIHDGLHPRSWRSVIGIEKQERWPVICKG